MTLGKVNRHILHASQIHKVGITLTNCGALSVILQAKIALTEEAELIASAQIYGKGGVVTRVVYRST